ncbi:hypothetical protein [Nonomuraea sp. NPDC049784]|uniref:hypothetical protein n=1 Tax=Nonomuraea sp. NPDC049784 TaxID=3154361 RepID=UPI003411E7AD
MAFTSVEATYLPGRERGQLATVAPDGTPQRKPRRVDDVMGEGASGMRFLEDRPGFHGRDIALEEAGQ